MLRIQQIPGVLILALALTACAGAATPQLIGSYPQTGEAGSPGYYEAPSVPRLFIAYNASLELEVDRPTYAVYEVQSIAAQYGGYLLNSRTWQAGGDEYAEANIAVPVPYFESARARLRSLGEVRSESVSGEIRDFQAGWYDGADSFSNITVSLRPSSAGWLRKIGGFFTGVFRFLVSLAPPVLMLIGLFTVVRTAVNWVRARTRPRPE